VNKNQANTPIRPQLLTEQIVEADESTEEGGVQAEIKEIDELRARVDELSRQHADRDSGKVPMVNSPSNPTAEEVERHELTHANFKPWCAHCQAGLAQRDRHMRKSTQGVKRHSKRMANDDADVPDCETNIEGTAKFSIDYFKLLNFEDGNLPYSLVMVSHEDGGIFSYAVPSKGIQGNAYWVPKRLAKDIDNCGTQKVSVQVKSDQEPAIVNVQDEVRYLRKARTVCTNSPVGESECNGRAENAIRRVEAKVRTLRSDLESKLKVKINMSKPIATWMIRWAGEILTKYTVGRDGKLHGNGGVAKSVLSPS